MRTVRLVAIAAGAALLSGAASAQTIGFATGPQATPTNAAGSAVAKVVNETTGLQTRAVPHTSNEISLGPLSKGQVDFAIANIFVAEEAITGTGTFDGRKLDNIRVVTRLFPLNLGVIVRKSSNIHTMADLKGHCYPAQFTAQKGQIVVATALLANAGLSYKDVKGNPVPNTSRSAEDFVQGRCDSAMMALGAARLKQVDAQVGGVRILPIDTSAAAMERLRKLVPHATSYSLKAGTLPGAEKSMSIMSYDILLVTSLRTKDDVVYQTAKAMHQNRDKMVAVTPVLRDFDPSRMYNNYRGVPYHPAAVKYYKEAGVALMN